MSAAADEGVPKRPRAVKIGTHSGSFHCDEALGCYLLRQTAQFEGAPVTRRCDFKRLLEMQGNGAISFGRWCCHSHDFERCSCITTYSHELIGTRIFVLQRLLLICTRMRASCARSVDAMDLTLPFPDHEQAICCSLLSTSLGLPFGLSIVHHDISLSHSRGRVCSRDPEVWKDMDVLIDVGGEYDPEKLRYDHHQRGFAEVFGHGFSTKLSSAGLVYKHHGKELVASAAPTDSPALRPR